MLYNTPTYQLYHFIYCTAALRLTFPKVQQEELNNDIKLSLKAAQYEVIIILNHITNFNDIVSKH